MSEKAISLTVNGTERELSVEPRTLLVHAIREELDLTGTHIGCDTGNCGACTVYKDGEAVKSCLMFAVQADGSEVLTVEGMEELPEAGMGQSDLHPIQEGFKQMHGLQCGYCTPGMIMAGKALLEANDDPGEREIREEISGNLCRCTGYQNIVKSIEYAADVFNEREPPESPLETEESEMETAAADGGEARESDSEEARTDGGQSPCGQHGCGCDPALNRDYPKNGGETDE